MNPNLPERQEFNQEALSALARRSNLSHRDDDSDFNSESNSLRKYASSKSSYSENLGYQFNYDYDPNIELRKNLDALDK